MSVCLGEAKIGTIRDRDRQIEALALGWRCLPLGLSRTRDAAVRAVLMASK
jgi:hypothetical protein